MAIARPERLLDAIAELEAGIIGSGLRDDYASTVEALELTKAAIDADFDVRQRSAKRRRSPAEVT